MATTAPINPIEVVLTPNTWTNITNGSNALDGKRVLVQNLSGYGLVVEPLSSATPNTTGHYLNPNNALPIFTKTASYDIWAKSDNGGKVRVGVFE